eukprot:GEMP01003378.1.p1 GENE.GEMP01003378.1~~GEMP01003378.1.p1  ORF type:complete len:603 (+),score=144.44 GEMP01003378.1:95-1903(+)
MADQTTDVSTKLDVEQWALPSVADNKVSSRIIMSDLQKVEHIHGADLKTCHERLHDECLEMKGEVRYMAIRSSLLENVVRCKKNTGKQELSKFWTSYINVDIGSMVKKGEEPSDDVEDDPQELARQADEEPVPVKSKFLRLASRMLDEPKVEQTRPTRAHIFWETNIDIDELLEISTTEDGKTNTAADPGEMLDRLITFSDDMRMSMEQINALMQEVRSARQRILDCLEKTSIEDDDLEEPLRLLCTNVRKTVMLKADLKGATTEILKNIPPDANKTLKEQVEKLREYGSTISTQGDISAILDELTEAVAAVTDETARARIADSSRDLHMLVRENSKMVPMSKAKAQRSKHMRFAMNRGMTGMRSMVGMRQNTTTLEDLDDPTLDTLTEKERRNQCKILLTERQRTKDLRKILSNRNSLLDRIVKVEKEKTVTFLVEDGELTDNPRCLERKPTGHVKNSTGSSMSLNESECGAEDAQPKARVKPSFIRIGTNSNLGSRPALKSSKSQMFWDSDLSIDDILGQCDEAEAAEDDADATIQETRKHFMGDDDDDDKVKGESDRRGGYLRSQSMAFWSSDVAIDDLMNMMPNCLEQVEEGDEEEED